MYANVNERSLKTLTSCVLCSSVSSSDLRRWLWVSSDCVDCTRSVSTAILRFSSDTDARSPSTRSWATSQQHHAKHSWSTAIRVIINIIVIVFSILICYSYHNNYTFIPILFNINYFIHVLNRSLRGFRFGTHYKPNIYVSSLLLS